MELLFALTRYKRYDVRALMVAGAAAGLGSLAVEWLFRRPDFAGEILAIKLAARAIGGALLAGWLGNVLANLTAASGALDRFIVGEADREPG